MRLLAKLLEIKTLLELLNSNDKPELVTIQFGETVENCIKLMMENDYSQLPVVKKGEIMGVISFASLIKRVFQVGKSSTKRTRNWQQWKAEDVMEKPTFKDYHEDLLDLIKTLANDSYVMIRTENETHEIITSFDVLHYFKKTATPFLFLNDIENTLRTIIQSRFDDKTFRAKATALFSYSQKRSRIPRRVDDMDFGDYITFISSHWTDFEQLLENKSIFLGYSETARDIRNDVCHFHGPICKSTKETLENFLNWLREKMKQNQQSEILTNIGPSAAEETHMYET